MRRFNFVSDLRRVSSTNEISVLATGLRVPCDLDGLYASYDVCCHD